MNSSPLSNGKAHYPNGLTFEMPYLDGSAPVIYNCDIGGDKITFMIQCCPSNWPFSSPDGSRLVTIYGTPSKTIKVNSMLQVVEYELEGVCEMYQAHELAEVITFALGLFNA